MHLYIHSVEASQHAERAEAYADRLAALAPHAGHLVHMPAHIYIRIGRYHDATLTNIAAAAADTRFLAACHANGLAYRLGYVPHNYHFGWVTAAMEGWSAKAAELARATSERIPVEMMREAGLGTLQQYFVTPLFDGVRFGRWDEILAYAAPAEDLVYARAIWQYAQGRAHAARGQMEAAQGDLETLVQIAADPRLAGITIWDINRATDLVAIAAEVLTGELAAARGEFPTAVTHLRRAVELEDALKYNEPPDWFYPVRHSLGAVLLAAGDAEGAREVYEQDLRIYRDNGWSLYGLAQALRALGQDAAAQAVEPRLRVAWQHADFELTGSRL
jgi:Flp pilus assembly protein TadD